MSELKARLFPQQEDRVETGPIQFGNDWPGIFIRGDNALALAMALRNNKAHPDDIFTALQVGGLVALLEGCDARNGCYNKPEER
jgi:hypothetical protein